MLLTIFFWSDFRLFSLWFLSIFLLPDQSLFIRICAFVCTLSRVVPFLQQLVYLYRVTILKITVYFVKPVSSFIHRFFHSFAYWFFSSSFNSFSDFNIYHFSSDLYTLGFCSSYWSSFACQLTLFMAQQYITSLLFVPSSFFIDS